MTRLAYGLVALLAVAAVGLGGYGMTGGAGALRLRAPWPADAVLAMAPFDHHGLAIYFWNGTHGVSLHYYQHARPAWVMTA